MLSDPRARHAPAAERNRQPIASVLERWFVDHPDATRALEVSSGTGQHVAYFGTRFPHVSWQPTEKDATQLESIRAWVEHTGVSNVEEPLVLDTEEHPWRVEPADLIVNVNLIHIAPWSACLGLLEGAARVLKAHGALVMYGPFNVDGHYTSAGNEAFDQSLRGTDPSWGIRDLELVVAEARARGLEHEKTISMPANNLVVILGKR